MIVNAARPTSWPSQVTTLTVQAPAGCSGGVLGSRCERNRSVPVGPRIDLGPTMHDLPLVRDEGSLTANGLGGASVSPARTTC